MLTDEEIDLLLAKTKLKKISLTIDGDGTKGEEIVVANMAQLSKLINDAYDLGRLENNKNKSESSQWLWRVFNLGWPRGHEESNNEWGPWSIINEEAARKLDAEDVDNVYEFVPYTPVAIHRLANKFPKSTK